MAQWTVFLALLATLAAGVRSFVILSPLSLLPDDSTTVALIFDSPVKRNGDSSITTRYSRPIRRAHELFGKRSSPPFHNGEDILDAQLNKMIGLLRQRAVDGFLPPYFNGAPLSRERRARSSELFG